MFSIAAGICIVIAQLLSNRYQTKQIDLAKLDRHANLYGQVFTKLLCSRNMYIEFTKLEGYEYPQQFLSFVDMVNNNPISPIAKRYRCLMADVIGPAQSEVLELIMCNGAVFQSFENDDLSALLTDYLLMASSYKILFARWKIADYSVHFSHRRFPPDLIDELHHKLVSIKRSKLRMLGQNADAVSVNVHAPSPQSDSATVEEVV